MPDESPRNDTGGNERATTEALLLRLPTPAAIVDRSGRVERANAAWTRTDALGSILVPAEGNLLDALAASPATAHLATGLKSLLTGSRETFAGDAWLGPTTTDRLRLFASAGAGESFAVLIDHIAGHHGAAPVEGSSRMQRIIDSAMDGIVTIDERGTIVMFNAAAERMFGVSADEAIGGTLERFIPADFRPTHAAHVRKYGKTGVSSRTMGNLGTVNGLRADGTEFPIEASISQVQVGTERYFSAILRDVTDRKMLEAQLLQAQKMEGVGRLAGGVAHDFNNLIMAIFNYLALATRRLGPEHNVTPLLNQAHLAAQKAADLTRQLLTFARRQVVHPRILCPRDVMADLTPMLHRLIGEDILLRTVFEEDTGNVRADPSQLEQVVVNLAVNARDAMPHGGTLTIETRNETLDAGYCRMRSDATPGDHVVISVTDTGTGMTPEVQSHLFEPFFTTKPVGKGTGLGLATCHGIAKQCGGHIGVYSELGKGTAVRVYLPRAHSKESSRTEKPEQETAPRGDETILLAEDSDIVREMLAEALRQAGYQVLTAASGVEALQRVDAHDGPIDLLLTDVVMPEMNGVELAKTLTARRQIPVIYMSGYTEETIAHHGVDTEKTPFIAKPCMANTLLLLIHRVLHIDARA